jgi:hypothetical protein
MIAGGGGVRNAAKPRAVTVSFPDKDTWLLSEVGLGAIQRMARRRNETRYPPGRFPSTIPRIHAPGLTYIS